MSQLIQMRHRIKAIETIKKITSAMRLVSRSLHTRMNNEKPKIITYQKTVQNLFNELYQLYPQWKSEFFMPTNTSYQKELFIIVGAQKGLCGTYNADLAYWIKNNQSMLSSKTSEIIIVGKKTNDPLKKYDVTATKQLEELKLSTLQSLTEEILEIIHNATPHYTHVRLISNYAQSFFVHKRKESNLVPLTQPLQQEEKESIDYLWLTDPQQTVDQLAKMFLYTTIRSQLFEALAGEQSARFIAMDNATRNANNFLDRMQLEYNKLRQAKITRELTELAANFQNR